MSIEQIGSYNLVEKIAQGGMGKIFKAVDTRSESVVAVKTLKESVDPYSETFLRFKREAEMLEKLKHDNILRFLDFIEKESKLYIVTEYLEGKNLKQSIEQDALDLNTKINFVLSISRALDYVHSQGIIHRDIKPSNIMVTHETKIKILDFGVANLMNFQKLFASKEGVVGSFAYMSPEQSGILKRNIDSRSDLYSLGILFYQLVTGELPYKAKNVGELIHQHIAQSPTEPIDIIKDLSPIINKIIIKLIKKDPDDRYQTAFGLAEDIEVYLSLSDEQKETFYLELGKKDRLKNLNYRTIQIGRKKETRSLLENLNNTVLGKGYLTAILGKSGMGKSRLLLELQKYVRSKNGYYISVISSEGNKNHPYFPFIDAVKKIIDLLSKLPESEAESLYAQIKENLGEEGVILSKLIPEMSSIVGEYQEGIQFERKENEIFFEKMKDFFLTISSPTHPLIITFDDAHFWDTGSVQFLDYFKDFINDKSFYAALSIREEETGRIKDLYNIITDLAKQGDLNIITLHELSPDDVSDLVEEVFGTIYHGKNEVAARLSESTQGNPLLIIENIKTLVEEQIIKQKKDGWRVDLDALSVFRFSSSIVDKILARLNKVNDNTKTVLSYAAVLGKDFHFQILSDILKELDFKQPSEKILDYLKEGIENGLIAETLSEKGQILYSFTHDKIIETLLSRMQQLIIQKVHRIAAKIIEEKYQETDRLYKLAYHYLKGDKRNKAYVYNLKAGRKAIASFSFKLAVNFFMSALEIIKKFGVKAKKTVNARINLTLEIVEYNPLPVLGS